MTKADDTSSNRAITPELIEDDGKAGRFLAFMLSGLFLYTILAMGLCVYLTWNWTR